MASRRTEISVGVYINRALFSVKSQLILLLWKPLFNPSKIFIPQSRILRIFCLTWFLRHRVSLRVSWIKVKPAGVIWALEPTAKGCGLLTVKSWERVLKGPHGKQNRNNFTTFILTWIYLCSIYWVPAMYEDHTTVQLIFTINFSFPSNVSPKIHKSHSSPPPFHLLPQYPHFYTTAKKSQSSVKWIDF